MADASPTVSSFPALGAAGADPSTSALPFDRNNITHSGYANNNANFLEPSEVFCSRVSSGHQQPGFISLQRRRNEPNLGGLPDTRDRSARAQYNKASSA